jgi:hypothetical protein
MGEEKPEKNLKKNWEMMMGGITIPNLGYLVIMYQLLKFKC